LEWQRDSELQYLVAGAIPAAACDEEPNRALCFPLCPGTDGYDSEASLAQRRFLADVASPFAH